MFLRTVVPAIAIVSIVIGAMLRFAHRRRRKQLRRHFGSEFNRTVLQQNGDIRRAEAILAERNKRVKAFRLRPLTPGLRTAYAAEWAAVQRGFVDDLSKVSDADRLISRVMADRGYPATDFEQRAADISVHYPALVQSYRTAYEITKRHEHGHATTEDLCRAMIQYRGLLDELLLPDKSNSRLPVADAINVDAIFPDKRDSLESSFEKLY